MLRAGAKPTAEIENIIGAGASAGPFPFPLHRKYVNFGQSPQIPMGNSHETDAAFDIPNHRKSCS